jgi:hypothetical protein
LVTTTGPAVWTPHAPRAGDADSAANIIADIDAGGPDPFADEQKWPAWKVTVAVVVFCGAFWTGVGYLAMRLLG